MPPETWILYFKINSCQSFLYNDLNTISLVISNQSFCAAEKKTAENQYLSGRKTKLLNELTRLNEKNKNKEKLTLIECKDFVECYNEFLQTSEAVQKQTNAYYQKLIQEEEKFHSYGDGTNRLTKEHLTPLIGKVAKTYRKYLELAFGSLLATCKAEIAQKGK